MKRTAVVFGAAALIGLLALVIAFIPGQLPPGPSVAPPVANPIVKPPAPAVPAPGPQVAGDVLKLTASISDPYLLAGAERETFLKIDIDAARLDTSERAPVNLVLVMDRSGSMAGEKMEQCRAAARHLVTKLDERDRFALVTFGSDVTTIIGSTLATASARRRMEAAIDSINEMGGTNISGGLEAGLAQLAPYREQYNVSRVVLLSDGQANEGISDPKGLAALARRTASRGVTLSAIGVGLDFNELVLESLAEYGGGSYHFLAEASQLRSIFARELEQAVSTVAIGPALKITPQPGVIVAEVFGYLAESSAGVTTVRLPDFAGGQHRKVVARLLVPAQAEGLLDVADVGLAYLDVTRGRAPGMAQLSVKTSVTSDARLAVEKRDKDVAATAAHANALKVLRNAGISYSQGQRDQAAQYVKQAEAELRKAEAEFGPSDEFKQILGEAQVFEKSLQAPPSSAAGARAAKRVHSFSNTAR